MTENLYGAFTEDNVVDDNAVSATPSVPTSPSTPAPTSPAPSPTTNPPSAPTKSNPPTKA